VVLGTSAGVPTRRRNHNGYALRWDDELLLFDPGEGTQRQMLLADVSAARVTRICITHFHGDHCLGLPGVLQRRAQDRPDAPCDVYFPAGAADHFTRMTMATASARPTGATGHPVRSGAVAKGRTFTLSAAPLDHRVPAVGWRVTEPDGRRMLPDRLEAAGVRGPAIGRLVAAGALEVDGRRVRLEDVSVPRRGQRFAFVMDTRLCDAAFTLADGADLLVCEATFLAGDEAMAVRYGHLTAAQAGRIAAEAGARRLVLTHFSQRYGDDAAPFVEEARTTFDGDVVGVNDLDVVAVPARDDAAPTTQP
jgi:ribonuclease Z